MDIKLTDREWYCTFSTQPGMNELSNVSRSAVLESADLCALFRLPENGIKNLNCLVAILHCNSIL